MNEFHFLRPLWLLALPAVILLVRWLLRHQGVSRSWASVCDPQLLPYLFDKAAPARGFRAAPWLIGMAATLLLLALAGPTWERIPQPVFRDQSALVIALDLSRSMQAADLKPDRLTRATLKITDILQARKGGQTALLVYAGEAFTVTPLTDDVDTIIAQLGGLEPGLMPTQGSRSARAIARAMALLTQAGARQGHVLLVTDGLQDEGLEASIHQLRKRGYRLSILGVGTPEGAPITLAEGGFLKDRQGEIVIPRLHRATLQHWAQLGGGRYADIRADDQDVRLLLADEGRRQDMEEAAKATRVHSDQWREQGPWLILLLLPLAALAFRRGLWGVLILLCLPLPQPAQAVEWTDLWLRNDQQAMKKLQQGQAREAADLFQDREWKAAAQYRAGQYAQAAATLEGVQTPDALYNRGNALARAGDPAAAMASYEAALQLDPQHEDARYNLKQLQQQMPPSQSPDDAPDESQDPSQNESQEQSPGNESPGKESQDNRNDASDAESTDSNPADQNPQQPGQTGEDSSQEGDSRGANPDRDTTDQEASGDGNGPPPATDDESQGKNQHSAEDSSPELDPPADTTGGSERQQPGDPPQATHSQGGAMDPPPGEEPESVSASEQWLRRIPDDPSGLLRRKFLYQYQQQSRPTAPEEEPW